MLFRDGQLKRMRVKESYLEEKRKELGDLFTTDDLEKEVEKNKIENSSSDEETERGPIADDADNNIFTCDHSARVNSVSTNDDEGLELNADSNNLSTGYNSAAIKSDNALPILVNGSS